MNNSALSKESQFAPLDPDRIIYEDDYAVAFYDRYPVSPGHTLVVAKQVSESIFDLPVEIQCRIWHAVAETRDILHQRHIPVGYNIGMNDGSAAGQTVNHAHIHIIPRFDGDQLDPRGGIRLIFPDKARYWDEE